jgi:hypothetical protein
MRLPGEHRQRPVTLVWLDADQAILLRSGGPGATATEPRRIHSEVPPHHRATGRAHQDPSIRSGGGADPDDLAERRREHLLATYLRGVQAGLPPDDHLVILGPGHVHARLAAQVRADDLRHRRNRPVEDAPAPPLTDRQLRARLLAAAGAAPERRRPPNAVASGSR